MAQGGRHPSQRQAQRQHERQARRAQRRFKARLLRWILFGVVALIALTLVAGLLVVPGLVPTGGATQALSPDDRLEGPGEHLAMLPAFHISETDTFAGYNSIPPTTGNHWAVPAEWGIYDEPVPNERQVHNLEHGGIIIQYDSEDEGLIARLEELARSLRGFPSCVIVAPYPDMEHPIALTAWGVLLTMDDLDEAAIREFANFYRDEGPERIACR